MEPNPSSETQTDASLSSVVVQNESAERDVKEGLDTSAKATDQPDKVEKSLEDTLKEHLDGLDKEESTSSEDDAAEGDVSKTNETKEEEAEKKDETKEESSDQENADEASDVEKKPVPYDRFEKVIHERDEQTNEVARLTPLAKRQEVVESYLQSNNISNDDFVQAMELAALLKSNPDQFAQKMRPILEGIGVLTGDKLPDDLKAQADEVAENVSTGALSKEVGDRILNGLRETAKLRAQLKFGEERGKHSAAQSAAKQQQDFVKSIQSAWTGWATTVSKKDPSFKPKTNGSADGVFEMVNDKITALASQTKQDGSPVHPIRNQAEAVAIAELAYKSVSESLKGFRPRPSTRRAPLLSNGSQITANDTDPLKAKTLEEALAIGVSQRVAGKRNW